ncbi:MAG: LytTR family DNA-binding domain-containing protein [Lachnospira sp.]|nr:LytTR family DNA-binding domain-containing protein [Lachnospira sp.]
MREKIHIAVCDDLQQDRQFIAGQIEEVRRQNHYEIEVDEYDSGEAFLASEYQIYDLIFMDIYMGHITGMQTVRNLVQTGRKTQIIFCSTSPEYAAESYEVDAMYYLVKPIEKRKIQEVLHSFFRKFAQLEMITVKTGRTDQDIYVSDIIYVESANKKCMIHTVQECVEASLSLKEMEELLPRESFIRPIRYALVSLKHIISIPSDVLRLSNGESISVSRSERITVKEAFEAYKWNEMFDGTGV